MRARKTPLGCLSLGRYCGRTPSIVSRRECGLAPNNGSRRDCGLEQPAAELRRARERAAATKTNAYSHGCTHMDIMNQPTLWVIRREEAPNYPLCNIP